MAGFIRREADERTDRMAVFCTRFRPVLFHKEL